MLGLNKQQWYTVIKLIFAVGGPGSIVLSRVMHLDNDTVSLIIDSVGSLLSVVGAVALISGKSDSSIALDAKDLPGVQLHVDTSFSSPAPISVQELAENRHVVDILPMLGGPRFDFDKPPANGEPSDKPL